MGKPEQNLSHEEIWDDSTLIDSWNDALEEYKKYHSIHARGGSVRDLEPKQPKAAALSEPNAMVTEEENAEEDRHSIPAVKVDLPSSQGTQAPPSFPIQTVLGSVQDESLKKLLMSWYYAGYYTGLYEGQQQAQQSSQS